MYAQPALLTIPSLIDCGTGDDTRPRCQNCRTRNVTCHWGLKASFHPSRQAELADHERQRLASVESSRRRYPSVHFVDCTGQIEGYFKGDGTTDEDLLLSLVAPDGANDIVECHDEPQNRAPALCEQRSTLR